jgi:hypothetical protein
MTDRMPHTPSILERIGDRVLLLLVGPLDRIAALHARGRTRFALTRGLAYATFMLLGLVLVNMLAGVPILRGGPDVRNLLLRLGSYWAAQFVVGALVSLLIWRMVERIAEFQRRAAQSRGPCV